jgi:hypothetical protein
MVVSLAERRAVLIAALGFPELRQQPLEVAILRRLLDTWNGVGAVITGMERQGYNVSLTRYPQGWRATFLARDHTMRPWVGQVLSFHETPWQAGQHAAWTALDGDGPTKTDDLTRYCHLQGTAYNVRVRGVNVPRSKLRHPPYTCRAVRLAQCKCHYRQALAIQVMQYLGGDALRSGVEQPGIGDYGPC